MIHKVYSKRHRNGWIFDAAKRSYFSWKFDVRYRDGSGTDRRKKQSGFISESEARTAADKFTHATLQSRYGIAPLQPAPTLAQLVSKHLPHIPNRRERVRGQRILNTLLNVCGKLQPINELHSSHLLLLVERWQREGLSASTINRNLNIVSSTLHAGPVYFPALSQWRCPRIPRPKASKRRRERVIKTEEVTHLLTHLYRAREAGESEIQEAKRRNVAHVFRLCLLTASRPGEIKKIRWDQIDWQAGKFAVVGSKTEFTQAVTTRYPVLTNTIAEIFRERWQWQEKGHFPWQQVDTIGSFSPLSKLADQKSSESAVTSKADAPNSLKNQCSTSEAIQNPLSEQSTLLGTPRFSGSSKYSTKIGSLNQSCSGRDSRFVFTSNGGEVTDYYQIIRDACETLGLLYGRKTLGGFVTHDMRHTAVSYLVEVCGYDLRTVGDLTGHSDKVMVMLYSHSKRKTIEAAYTDLDKFAGTGTLGQ